MTRSVLIVEDDSRFSQQIGDALACADDLRLAGIAVGVAQGMAALDGTRPDVLLVDLGLPDGSGIEVIRHAAENHPTCEAVVLSVFNDDATIIKCLCTGATGFLLKDERTCDILDQIRRLCDGGSPISPYIARRLVGMLTGRSSDDRQGASLLSSRETSALHLSSKGYNSEEIAGLMGISRHTVETYIKRVYRKLQVHSRTAAIHEARALGLIP